MSTGKEDELTKLPRTILNSNEDTDEHDAWWIGNEPTHVFVNQFRNERRRKAIAHAASAASVFHIGPLHSAALWANYAYVNRID